MSVQASSSTKAVSPPASTTSGAPPAPGPPNRSSSKTARAASALKSGVVYGGSALLSGVNALVEYTPHFSGAVDVVVVEQPDGSYRSTPFYVRFGKYTHLRAKDRTVNIHINGELAPFTMHLGEYGQAYFISDAPTISADADDDEQQSMLAGMMSPESGYSSGEEDRPQYANQQVLDSVQEEVQRLKDAGQLGTSPPGQLSSHCSGVLRPSLSSSGSPRPADSMQPGPVDRAQQLLELASGSSTSPGGYLCNDSPARSPPAALLSGSVTSRLVSSPALGGRPNGAGSVALEVSEPGHAAASMGSVSGVHTQCDMSHTLHVVGFPENVPETAASEPLQELAVVAGGSPVHTTTSFRPDVQGASVQGADLIGNSQTDNAGQISIVDIPATGNPDSPPRHVATSPAVDVPGRGSNGSHAAHAAAAGAHPTSLLSLSLKANTTLGSPVNSTNPPASNGLHPSLSLTSFIDESSPRAADQSVQGVQGSGPAANGFQQEATAVVFRTDSARSQAPNGSAPGSTHDSQSSPRCGPGDAEQVPQPQLPHSEALPMPSRAPTARSEGVLGTSATSDLVSGLSQHASSWQLSLPPPALSDIPRSLASTQLHAAPLQLLPPSADSGKATQDASQQAGGDVAMMRLAAMTPPSMQGLELSLCGNLLQPGCSYSEAVQVFEAYRVGPAEWAEKGVELVSCPHLVVRLQGEIYPWAAAAPLVLGWTAFGAWWPHLVAPDAPRWAPPSGLTPSASMQVTAMPGPATKSTWRALVWPFSSRRNSTAPVGDKSVSGTPPLGTSPSTSSLTRPPPAPASTPNHLLDPTSIATTSAPPALLSAQGSSSFKSVKGDNAGGELGGPGAVSFPALDPRMSASARQLSLYSKVSMARKTLSPSWAQLRGMRLREGQNTIRYSVGSSAELVAYVYFYHWATKLVISDIDGTITKSDVLGHLLPAMGWDWSHAGISRLFTDIAANSYQLMYLSSRSISQAGITRDYLRQLVQGQHRMPEGPVIISPHGLLPSLYREMILRRPHEFKIATLQDIRALFPADWNPFYAGFGNRDTDEISYREVGVPVGRIFIINPKGELRKAAVTMQSSSLSTLASINELVHDIFPPIVRTSPSTALPAPPPSISPAASLPDALSGPSSTTSVPAAGSSSAVANGKGNGEEGGAAGSPAASTSPAVDGAGGSTAIINGGSAGATGSAAQPPKPGRQQSAPERSPKKPSTADLQASQAVKSQQMLLSALQAAEQYNDLNFWNSDPSALMAGDLDELEKMLVAVATPQKNLGAGMSAPPASAASNGDPLSRAASVAQKGEELLEGEEEEEEEEDGSPTRRRSHDFIATYNPFAY